MKKQLTCSKLLSLLTLMLLFLVVDNRLHAQVLPSDRNILIELYKSTNGANWNTKWDTLNPVNTWYGIKVVSDQITEIRLKDNNLEGTIPADLGDLLSLQYLDLDTNKLSGIIPVELAQLENLEYLYLNGNQLTDTIPSELGQLTNLLLLYLNDNLLTGSIPSELKELTSLKWLNLSRNQLTGSIPSELGQLSSLEYLQLALNQLTGSIPAELSQLSALKWLNLSDNQLDGEIPVELKDLSNLEQLYLNGNQLIGNIPIEMGQLIKMKWLNLGQNILTGGIPAELSAMSNLELLYLDGNQLTFIPSQLGQLIGLEWLNLSDNQITGDIPAAIWQLINLKLIYLNGNQFTGTIPDDLTSLPGLKWLHLNSNKLGSIPDFTLDTDTMLQLFVYDNQLTFEDIEYNMDIMPDTIFIYSPQDSIGELQTFVKNEGENFSYTLTTGGTQNSYQWYKDGEILDTQISATLEVNSVTTADAGKFYCEVTNTLVPGLTLTSREIELIISGSQSITFNAGWNIFSSPYLPEDKNIENILQPLITAGVLKKVMDEEGITLEDWGVYGGWINGIVDMESTEGYKINVTSETSLVLQGVPAQFPFEIQLDAGWNIISWPSINEQDGMDVFQVLIGDGILKKVMDEAGRTIEDFGVYGGWENFIGNLKPGEGYKVNVTSATTLIINESGQKSAVISPEIITATHFKPVFEGHGVDHMNINLVNLSESGIMEGDEIGIFDGNNCVGAAKVAMQNSSVINLIASASESNNETNGFKAGNDISLKLYRNGNEYPLSVIPLNSTSPRFEKNGTLFAKVNADLNTEIIMPGNEFDVAIYPNPFNDVINIEINLLQRSDLTVEIYDLLSRRIRQLYNGTAEGRMKLHWDANDSKGNKVTPGVYICRINGIWKKVVLN